MEIHRQPTPKSRFDEFTYMVDQSKNFIRHTQKGRNIREYKAPIRRHIDSDPTVRELGDEIENLARNFQVLSYQLEEVGSMMENDENMEPNTEKCDRYKTSIQNTLNTMRPLSGACKLLATFIIQLGEKPKKLPSGKHGRELKILPLNPRRRAARR